jgi:hypothetical protein
VTRNSCTPECVYLIISNRQRLVTMAGSRHPASPASDPLSTPHNTDPPHVLPEETLVDAAGALDEFPVEPCARHDTHDLAVRMLESMMTGREVYHRRRSTPFGSGIARVLRSQAAYVRAAGRGVRAHMKVAAAVALLVLGAGPASQTPLAVPRTSMAALPTLVKEPIWVALAMPVAASVPTTVTAVNPRNAQARAAVAAAPGRSAVPPSFDVRQAQRAVQSILNRYRDAFSILDAGAVKRIWPTANERAIRDEFAAVGEQNIEFDGCRIAVSPPTATALCSGTVAFTPAEPDGRRQVEPRHWRFTLERNGERWTIARVAVSASNR